MEEDSDTGMYHLEYLIVSVPTSASASDGLGGSACAQAHVDGERWVQHVVRDRGRKTRSSKDNVYLFRNVAVPAIARLYTEQLLGDVPQQSARLRLLRTWI